MPSFDSLKVKNLSVKRSETTPVDVVSHDNKILYGFKDSGKTFQVSGVPVTNWTLTLPGAEKGRYVSFVVTGTNNGKLTLITKTGSDVITGKVLNANSNENSVNQLNLSHITTNINYIAVSNGSPLTATLNDVKIYVNGSTASASAATVYLPSTLLLNTVSNVVLNSTSLIGSKLDFICLSTGVWTLTGTTFSENDDGVSLS